MNNFTHVLNRAIPKNEDYLVDRIRQLPRDILWEVKVKPYKKQRTLQQNKWVRKYAASAGAHFGYSPDEMYEILMYKHNPRFIIDKTTSEEIRTTGHFSDLDTAEAAAVQNQIELWGIEHGFVFSEDME